MTLFIERDGRKLITTWTAGKLPASIDIRPIKNGWEFVNGSASFQILDTDVTNVDSRKAGEFTLELVSENFAEHCEDALIRMGIAQRKAAGVKLATLTIQRDGAKVTICDPSFSLLMMPIDQGWEFQSDLKQHRWAVDADKLTGLPVITNHLGGLHLILEFKDCKIYNKQHTAAGAAHWWMDEVHADMVIVNYTGGPVTSASREPEPVAVTRSRDRECGPCWLHRNGFGGRPCSRGCVPCD